MAAALPEYEAFQPKHTPDDAPRWIEWMEGFQALVSAMNIPDDSEARHNQPARTQWYDMLWHYVGEDTRRLLKKLYENVQEEKNYVKAKGALERYFTNRIYQRIYQMQILNEIKQEEGESMDNFYARVKAKVDIATQALPRDKIVELVILSCLVQNTNNIGAKQMALSTPDMDIKRFLTYARSADHHMTNMSEQASEPAANIEALSTYFANATSLSERESSPLRRDGGATANSVSRTPNQAGFGGGGFPDGGSDSAGAVLCDCHETARQYTTRKPGPNYGRQFYSCHKPQDATDGCKFFLWADQSGASSSSFGTPVVNRGLSNPAAATATPKQLNYGSNVCCKCGIPTKRLTVKKDTPNKGRQFYVCAKPQQEDCKFFRWADGQAATPGGGGKQANSGSTDPAKKRRKCGLCGEEGHNRKNCPHK